MANNKIYRAVASSAAATGISRLLGALRDMAIASMLGDSEEADAFWMAFTIPSIFRRFVADEGLTGVMVPALTKKESEKIEIGPENTEGSNQDLGEEELVQRLAGGLFVFLVMACFIICIVGILIPEALVGIFASGFEEGSSQYALTVELTRWMMPFLLFVSLVSWSEGLLNIKNHYFLPKLAPGIVSGAMVTAVLANSFLTAEGEVDVTQY